MPPSLLRTPGAQLLPNSRGKLCRPEIPGRNNTRTHKTTDSGALPAARQIRSPRERLGLRSRGGNSAACPWLPLLLLAGYSSPAAAFCSAAQPVVFITRLRACRGCFSSHPALLVLPSIRGAAGGRMELLPARGPCAAGGCGLCPGCSPTFQRDAGSAQAALPPSRGMQALPRLLFSALGGCRLFPSCSPGSRGMQAMPKLLSQLPEGCRLCPSCFPSFQRDAGSAQAAFPASRGMQALLRRLSRVPEGCRLCSGGSPGFQGNAGSAQAALLGSRGMQALPKLLSRVPGGCRLCSGGSPGFRGLQAVPRLPAAPGTAPSPSCCHTGCAGTAFLRDAWLRGGGGNAAGRGGDRERDG
ncbi:uncharacterized protein LOC119711382 [Motacilla alba alba]|uniref:uncharacterized protein LOC119711382 n=1 Tax=Motacilla alba alba TaxID=1094192 RepID=UPI0018D56010|nr:uncharacterized protein LOC119711382 [Motacilla alba alba]